MEVASASQALATLEDDGAGRAPTRTVTFLHR